MPNRSINPFVEFPVPPKFYYLWEDFDDELALTSNLPVAASSRWVGTALSSGTFAQSTDEAFGVAVLSGAATTDNSGAQIQGDMEYATLVAGKRLQYFCRAKLSDATNTHFFNGLALTDTTLCDGADGVAGMTATDAVGFYKADDAATVAFLVKRDSAVLSNLTLATLADDTYYWFAFEVVMDSTTAGLGTLQAWVFNGTNGTLIATSGPIQSATLPYSAEEVHTLSVGLVSGNATGTKTATIDAIGMLQER